MTSTLVLLLVGIGACSDGSDEPDILLADPVAFSTVDCQQQIIPDPECEEWHDGEAEHQAMVRFEEVIAEVGDRARSLGLTASDLEPYFATDDEEGLRQLLGYSQEWADQRATEMADLEEMFYFDHPHMSEYEAPLGDYENLYAHLDYMVDEGAFNMATDPMTCEKKVLVAYAVCATGPTIIGLACMYLAMCTYCEGGVADQAC